MTDFIIHAIAVGYITYVITHSEIMSAGRQWLVQRVVSSRNADGMASHILGLVSCPFCTGFWVAVVLNTAISISAGHPPRPIDAICYTSALAAAGGCVASAIIHIQHTGG